MISHLLVTALSVSAQGNLASARTQYSRCLGAFTRAQVRERVDEAAFTANLQNVCKSEEAAFRAASVATDIAAMIARATAERNAQEEIGYIHENAVETFKASLESAPR